jgi:hypothetical protein
VAGSCECGDEPQVSGDTELVNSYRNQLQNYHQEDKINSKNENNRKQVERKLN